MTSPLGDEEGAGVGARSQVSVERGSVALRAFSGAWATLGGSRAGRRVLKLAGIRPLARAWLRSPWLKAERSGPDDVTVLIGVRDRSDYRIVNALRSLRDQTYSAGKLKIMVVDYGSASSCARVLERVSEEYRADLVRIEAPRIWSRARCLNGGLRLVDTRFTMVSDADVLLSPDYVADAVKQLKSAPLSVVCAPMLDLPETMAETLRDSAREGRPLRLVEWREQCEPRLDWAFHPSITITYSQFFRLIRGYDEHYEGWGKEDDDLMKRFESLGLVPTVLPSSSFYLHQWHPKFEGLTGEESARSLARNAAHFKANHSILRNAGGWGSAQIVHREASLQ